jgi:hypothetical protein
MFDWRILIDHRLLPQLRVTHVCTMHLARNHTALHASQSQPPPIATPLFYHHIHPLSLKNSHHLIAAKNARLEPGLLAYQVEHSTIDAARFIVLGSRASNGIIEEHRNHRTGLGVLGVVMGKV